MYAGYGELLGADLLDDRELIARFLAGERDCFGLLVRRHASPLWATLKRNVGDPEEARDVFQETWLRAFERISSLRDATRLRSWLLSIALNLVRQGQRRSPVRIRPIAGWTEVEPFHEEDASRTLEAQDELAFLRRRIERLPPRQREVLDLRMNHGLSHAEVAAMLEISEESSRANYYQALRRLRAEFEAQEGDPR